MGGPKTLTATWDVVAGGPPSSPGVDVVPWIVLAILVAVIALLILFLLWRRRRKEDEDRPPPPAS